jgi:hypothetical protein
MVFQRLVCRDKEYYRIESWIGPWYLLSGSEDTTKATDKKCEI